MNNILSSLESITSTRNELTAMATKYTRIRDCLAGEDAIKAKQTVYLPMPTVELDEAQNQKRYFNYLQRACFYNATKATLKGLHGQIFMRQPDVKLPEELNFLLNDADGKGLGLIQLVKRACLENLALGRGGFFVDYPDTGGAASFQDLESGRLRPYIYFYAAEQIINWRSEIIDGKHEITLIVLKEEYDLPKNNSMFNTTKGTLWRVLMLEDGVYHVQTVYSYGAGIPKSLSQKVIPTDAAGNVFSSIPFFFMGSENNDADVDSPPLDDIATLNIAHYRNSADYEDSCFFTGQPTLVINGLTQSWVEEHLNDGIMIGSRTVLMLNEGADAKFLQAAPNSMPFEAMKHKEKQMVALGAKLVEQPGVVRTASEAEITFNTENSVLSSVALNVASAIQLALFFAARYVGISDDDIKFNLNTDFDIANLSPEKLRQLVESWQKGSITLEELRGNLRKAGIANMEDEKAAPIIKSELEERSKLDNNNSTP